MINFTFRKASNVELVSEELSSVLRISSFFREFALVCKINFVPMASGCEGRAIVERRTVREAAIFTITNGGSCGNKSEEIRNQ